MNAFKVVNGELHCESVPLVSIAKEIGTPAYVYSRNYITNTCDELKLAFSRYPTLACFAVKANSNLGILREIFLKGLGADIVSVGELERVLAAGGRAEEIVFSSIGKRNDEIARALKAGILSFNAESVDELVSLNRVAQSLKLNAPVSLRINPNIDAKTHPYIATGLYTTKFGLAEPELEKALATLKQLESVTLVGLSTHIGSQITTLRPFRDAAKRMAFLADKVMRAGFALKLLDLGGGLGISYQKENPPALKQYANALIQAISPTGLRLLIEPGRIIVGNSGVLLTRVLGIKKTPKKTFVTVDAAMNDLIRPVLYGAYHEIVPIQRKGSKKMTADIVGPICETGDCFGEKRKIPVVQAGDLVAIKSSGAYGFSMASNYNTRPRPAEVLVDKKKTRVIRRRETLESLWALELF